MATVSLPREIQTNEARLRFGAAELDIAGRELRIEGRRAALGPRAFGLLRMLVENRGRTVSKHELLETVWRGVVVEENNLQVQISTLRRLLGAQAIATIPGRGYRFVLPVEDDKAIGRAGAPWPAEAAAAPPSAQGPAEGAAALRRGNMAARTPDLYGRAVDCAAVEVLLAREVLVCIVGSAGIGKTRLALALAAAAQPRFKDGAWLVELAPLNDPQLLAQTVAQALRLKLPGLRKPLEELAAALHGQQALLVLDNCEHLVEAAGELTDRLLRDHPQLRILATSQEPLRLAEEHVYRLAPLSVPLHAAVLDVASYGAVQLFVERVRALLPGFELNSGNSDAVVELCRRLDGLALAIEFAAARVPVLGVAGVLEHLGERFRMLTGGSRLAPRRHQTLRAAMDWSHALLQEEERAVYRRLGIFVGSFSLEDAQALASSDDIDAWTVLEHLSSLVDKSLVIAEGEPRPRYRLLESTREHALEQLAAAGEIDGWMSRHAAVTRRALEDAIRERRIDLVLAETGNVRSAYEWARGVDGNAEFAIALATLPSMVMAVNGAVQEARQRLLEVESLVTSNLPPALVAQYWQWYGRIGLDGRLQPSRCIEAFRRAEALFAELGNLRHVHACRRHTAEALLDAGDLESAAAMLDKAKAMESESWPVADSMRRLRVEGLWLAKTGRTDKALQTSLQALQMAQQSHIDRYELVLLDDIARMQLEAGHAGEAAQQYRALAALAQQAPTGGLTLSNALSGLVAALTFGGDGELDEAMKVAREALPMLGRCGILLARADILACLLAHRGLFEAAARLVGASDRFRTECEMARDPIEQRCHDEALHLLCAAVDELTRTTWMTAGARSNEDVLVRQISLRAD